eukprot:m.419703 g.419703  ORF g.419703 m.419703 type:complete len:551 (+) comp21308_c0_seq1:304-1956(+)
MGALPHILFLLVDDFGWANTGWHRLEHPTAEVSTPNMDALVKNGLELDRHYVYKFCSPTRSALQSGRNPIHVNLENVDVTVHNPSDPISGFQGIPRNMTGIAEKMRSAGYYTAMVGKWDAGMATPDHTPQGRGYMHSLNYFHHCNDYWTSSVGVCREQLLGPAQAVIDLWDTQVPSTQNGTSACGRADQPVDLYSQGCSTCFTTKNDANPLIEFGPFNGSSYNDELFTNRMLDIIKAHDPTTPLLFFWAPHTVHIPLQVPKKYVDEFDFITDNKYRKVYHAMVKHLDDDVGKVVELLHDKGMYNDTLIVMSSDNGGPVYFNGTSGGNNYPLRGGKMNNWEGGIRVNAFVSGGYLPAGRRGQKEEGLITAWDWYATFCHIAGVDATDTRAALAGLPPIDSHNVWPLVSGANMTSPRIAIPLGSPPVNFDGTDSINPVNGLILGQFKVLIGKVAQASWQGPEYPNASKWMSQGTVEDCSADGKKGCLFNIFEDPTEHNDLASTMPEKLDEMLAALAVHQKTAFTPNRGKISQQACDVAIKKYGGTWGPFVDI